MSEEYEILIPEHIIDNLKETAKNDLRRIESYDVMM